MTQTVKVDTDAGILSYAGFETPCTIGRGGTCNADAKIEGDGCTPIGRWPVEAALFRPGRAVPPQGLSLPWRWTLASDGWSDDVTDPAYNRPVRLPHGYSAESLHRADPLYDIIVVLGHNLHPPVPAMGSAIFFHLWNDQKPAGERSTEGCVAIAREAMLSLLPQLSTGAHIEIF